MLVTAARCRKAIRRFRWFLDLPGEVNQARLQVGRLQSQALATLRPDQLGESEFQVFSQFGEDGIIQFLVQRVPIERRVFVEFGVEDYRESNTRFLLTNDYWQGLIIDGSSAHQRFLESSGLGWRYRVDAVTAFIDRDNINGLIEGAGLSGDIGLVSIDLDGNDYWVLEALEAVAPRILVLEYNSTFGPAHEVTIPYDPAFVRSVANSTGLYWGASLSALAGLAKKKGYALVGGNRAGNNAFFVRRDMLGDIPEVRAADVWRRSSFRESRANGVLTYVGDTREQLHLIASMPLWDVALARESTVGELYEL